MSLSTKPIITIFGTSKAVEGDAVFTLAAEAGRALAEAGFDIANGGYGGTMLASAQGAAGAGGQVFGVTCKAFRRGKANPFVSTELSTENLDQRLKKLVEIGDGYLVLPGGTGTLLELAYVWEHKHKRFETVNKPIVVMRDFWRPLVAMMEQADPACKDCLAVAEDAAQAAEYLKRHLISTE
jgi:uncharacterized protein (TIGR00730 family)